MNKIEIMAPAGSWESLHTSLNAGADSVYFGLEYLNMRARASNNFNLENLNKIVALCNKHSAASYVTLNTVIYDNDITLMHKICDACIKEGVTAIIASDLSVITYAHSIGLEVHLSTQANISNTEAVRFYSQYADVVVLARELSLEQIKTISSQIKEQNIRGPKGNLIRLELFVHGALCVGISGKCYMSLAQYNYSANRGACLQACRRRYKVIEEETGQELILDNQYIMSPKDLCTITVLDQIVASGVVVLKIEGRGRSPEYVHTVIKTYRDALDSISKDEYTTEKIETWKKQLESVYNRGFWQGGYYLGHQLGEWTNSYGSQSTTKKEYIGKITNYFSDLNVAEIKLETGSLTVKDKILIIGPTTGVLEESTISIHTDKPVEAAYKGELCAIKVASKVRRNDKIYKILKK